MDIEVAGEKFDAEVRMFKDRAVEHARRGILLIDASFPKAFAAFAFPAIRPAHLLFGVELDFTNYDLWPPSVTFTDPLTREPWPNGAVSPVQVIIPGTAKPQPLFLRYRPDPNNQGHFILEQPVICQGQQGPAFLCMRGVREYHEHPAHSGDSWLQYRGSGIGTLFYVLDKIHEYSIAHLGGMQIGLSYVSAGPPQAFIVNAANPAAIQAGEAQ